MSLAYKVDAIHKNVGRFAVATAISSLYALAMFDHKTVGVSIPNRFD